MLYIACPFSCDDPRVRKRRYEIATNVLFECMRHGIPAFSPVSHGFDVTEHYGKAGDVSHATWMQLDLAILKGCSALLVIEVSDWRESIGVTAEIDMARSLSIPIYYVKPGGPCACVLSQILAEVGPSRI